MKGDHAKVVATMSDRPMNSSLRVFVQAPTRPILWLAAVCLFAQIGGLSPVAASEPGAITKALGLRTTVPAAPDFVSKSRPKDLKFVPVHEPRIAPPGKPMAKEQVEKQERSLDAARRQHDRVAGRRSGPAPERSVADGMSERTAKPKAREGCGLTCDNPALQTNRPGETRP